MDTDAPPVAPPVAPTPLDEAPAAGDGRRDAAAAADAAFESALREACAGSSDGLSALFRSYQPRLLRYLRSREPRHADDIAAETWMAVASRIRWFEGDARSFASWLFTIARQRLADHRRTNIRRRTDPVPTVSELRAEPPIDDDVVDRLSAQEATDLIVRLLSHDQADVVLLRTLGGLDANEVAAVMGRDATWVRVTYHRAVQRLRERWPGTRSSGAGSA